MSIVNYFSVEEQRGTLLVRGFDDKGRQMDFKTDFEPTLYIPSSNTRDATSIYGDSLKRYDFKSITEANQWKKTQKDLGLKIFGDIGPEYQYIRSLEKPQHISPSDLNILMYDIETEVNKGFPKPELAEEKITLISTYDNVTKKVHIFSYKEFNIDYSMDELLSKYEVVEHMAVDEADLLSEFIRYWRDVNPHIISGWNIDGFDNLYIYNRIKHVLNQNAADSLSPFHSAKLRTFRDGFGKENTVVSWAGIASFDYLNLYKTYTFHPMENYRLDTVAQRETGASKLHHDGSFRDFYENHWDKFVSYNIRDSVLIKEIDDSTDLLSTAIMVYQICGANPQDTFGTVNKLDVFFYNYMGKKGLVIPPKSKQEKGHLVGAYVQDPELGFHKAVVSFDLNSLYPHLMMEYNISPETLVRNPPPAIASIAERASIDGFATKSVDLSGLKGTPYVIAPNGAVFDTSTKGFVAEIMEYLYSQRKVEKKEASKLWKEAQASSNKEEKHRLLTLSKIKDNIQLALKVLLNSSYGCVGSPTFRYFEMLNAAAITTGGQAAIKYIGSYTNEWLKEKISNDFNYLRYIDTDSNYFSLQPLLDKLPKDAPYSKKYELLKTFADGPMAQKIQSLYEEYAEYRNCPVNKMIMEREIVSVRGGFWVGKKKYALAADNVEGKEFTEEEPYWKIMGLEAIKAGKYTAEVRTHLKKIIELLITKTPEDVQAYIAEFKKDFLTWDVEDIANQTGVSNITKYVTPLGLQKGTPIGTRAVWNHNNYISQDVQPIEEGDKIKFVYLKSPNPIKDNVVAFARWADIQELEQYVDRMTQWEKNALSPITTMLEPCGVLIEKRNKLF